MPSEKGPYRADIIVKENGFEENVIFDKHGDSVLDFTNGRAVVLYEFTSASAQQIAANLTADDTVYRALLKAHYLGGTVTVNAQSINEILSVIAALEVASFAADPVAVAAIARLLGVIVLL